MDMLWMVTDSVALYLIIIVYVNWRFNYYESYGYYYSNENEDRCKKPKFAFFETRLVIQCLAELCLHIIYWALVYSVKLNAAEKLVIY